MRTFKASFAGFILFVLIASGSFVTCDIGLGNSVDTKPPTVGISYPPVDSVIKNTFTMKGSANDETSLKSVSVTLVNTVNPALVFGPFTAVVDPAAKTWTLFINNKNGTGKFEIPDGNYEATATATDAAGRFSTAKTTYRIDNTAPILVLDRPASVGLVNPDGFGSVLKVTGSANDQNAIQELVFTVFNASGAQVGAPIQVTGISGVGMDVVLAKYSDNPVIAEDINLNTIYRTIYDVGSAGTQSFYCTVNVSDEAREFLPPAAVASPANLRGNINSDYYIYSKIYSAIFSTNGAGVTMRDLTTIANGTYPDSAVAATILAILDTFKISATTWSTASSAFSLNPEKSPKYELVGYGAITDATIENVKVANESNITVKINEGLDKVPLRPETIRIVLRDLSQAPATPGPDIVLLPSVADLSGNAAAITARNAKLSLSGGSYLAALNIGPVPTKVNYEVIVTGEDQDSVIIDNSGTRYGFRVVSNGKPPTVTISTGPAILSSVPNAPISFTGIVETESGFGSFGAVIEIYDTLLNTLKETVTEPAIAVAALDGTWSYTIPARPEGLGAGLYADGLYRYDITFTAVDVENNATPLVRQIYMDNQDPTLQSFYFNKVVYEAGFAEPRINGTENTFSVQFRDNDRVSSASYTLNGGPSVAVASPESWTSPNIDSTAYPDNANITIAFTVTDRAGNISVITRQIYVNQATDRPVVTLTNLDAAIINQAGAISSNLLVGNFINGTIIDDDVVSTATITVRNSIGTVIRNAQPITLSGPDGSKTFSYSVSGIADGQYSFVISASDTSAVTNTAMLPVWFSFDISAPALTASVPPANTNAGFSITGTAFDSNALAATAITVTQRKDGGSAIPIAANGPTTGDSWANWALNNLPRDPASIGVQDGIDSSSDGVYEYVITVTDVANRISQVTRTVRFDATAAAAIIVNPPASPATGNVIGSSYTFTGTSADINGSGVSIVRYNLDNTAWLDAAGTGSWNATVAMSGSEGPRTLYAQVQDNAGNVSASVNRPFVYDTAIPAATVTGAANRDVNAAFSLTGFATDNYGIASIAVTQNGVLINTNGVTTGGTATNRSWTLSNLPRNPASIGALLVADGTFVYNVTAIDLAGKSSLIASVTVRVDTSAPDVNAITAPGAGQTGVNSLAGASYLFRGNASDAGVGVAKIWHAITASAIAPTIVTTPGAAGYTELLTTGNWSFSRLLPTELAQGLGYYLHVLAEDSSGNRTPTASAASVLFDVDLANPVAVENEISTTNIVNQKAAFILGGTAVDSHGIASVVVTQKLDDGTALEITPNGPSLGGSVTNRTWTLANLPRNIGSLGTLSLTDGLYEYVITVTDLAGKTHSLTRTVRFDATGPTLTVTAPAANSWANSSSVTVNGVASDLSGIKAIYYAQGTTEPALPADWSSDANWTGAGWLVAAGTSSWSFTLPGLTEGSKRVWIRSVDIPINVSTPQSLDFGVDLNTPSLTASVPPVNTNAGFSITGTSLDSNALAATAITVTQKKNSGAAVPIAVAGPTTGDSWANWTLANLPRDPASIGVQDGIDASSDGVYEYIITVTDVAGRTSQVTRTVRFDATDATSVIVNPPASPAAGNVIGASYNFTGTAADTGSGVSTVRYNLDNTAWLEAAGTGSWNATVAMSGSEGPRTLYAQVQDNAGNVSASISRPFVYDTAIPVATVTGAANRDVNAMFTLAGTATDNYGIDTITVTQNGTEIATNGVTTGGTVTNRSWTLSNLPRNPASIGALLVADGTFTYNVTAIDLAGKSSLIASVTVRVDTSAPDVNAITAPGAGQTGVNSLAGASYLFRGNASDAGVGVAKIWHAITASAIAPTIVTTPGAAGYTELLTTGNWSFSRLLPSELAQGLGYYLHVLAEDSSGNRTPTASAASVLFDVDLANPVAVENIANNTNVQNRKAVFTLGGTAADTHGIASVVVTQKLDDGAAVTISASGLTLGGDAQNRTWTLADLPRNPLIPANLSLTDGLYEYVVTVTDLAGKTHSLIRTIRFDATGPTLTVTAPAANSWANASTVAVNGVASDLTGVQAIYYALIGTEPNLPVDMTANANWTAEGWTVATGTISWNFSLTGLTEGNQQVWIRSLDTALNVSTPQSLVFGVDLNTPTLTASTPPVNTNGGFSIAGTSMDSNALAATAITVTQKKNSGAAVAIATNGPSTGDGWANWSLANLPRDPASIGVQDGIDVSSDGVYEYVITVTDVAGKTSQITRTVRFDLSLPTVVVTTDLTGWKGSPSLSVTGTAADTGSGIDLVEYSLDGILWNALSGTTAWSGNIPVADGTNTIRFRSRDAAVNYSGLNTHAVTVDLANPELNTTTPASLVRVNGQSNLATQFHATDLAGSGVASVRIKIGSSNFTTPNVSLLTPSAGTRLDGTWNLTIPAADILALTNDVQYVVYVQATDSVGNRTLVNFSILVDKAAPSVAITTPVNAATVNKSVTLSGTASDTQGVSSVLVEVQLASLAWETVQNFTGASANNWSVAGLSTVTYQDASYRAPLTIRATAADEAGNSASVTNTYTIDQDSDRPTVRLSNIDTDGTTTLINVRTVSGVVLDDDGTVALSNFKVSENGTTWIDATANPVVGPANPLFYDVETRSFQYSPSADDGAKFLYFRVTDGAGTLFQTPVVYDAGAVLTYPKIQYSLELGVIVGTRVSYNIDTNPPSINSDIYFDTTAPYTFDGAGALDVANRLLSNTVFGGTRSILALRVASYDAVGMDEVNIDIAGTNYTTTNVGNVATYDIFTTSSATPINVSALASGPATVTVTALDISGQSSTSSRQILIDNTDPIVAVTSHVMNEQVTGDVILRGTAEDGTGSGLGSVTYQVGADAAWTPVTGTFSWNISFTGANIITTTGTYANATHATEIGTTNVWILPIRIRAVDQTGNETIETFYLNINPDGDRPTVSVLYPTTGSTLGGTIRVFGSAQDNVSVASVWMMIDADGDGDYDNDDVTLLTGYGYTVAGSDANSWGFQISGTASWSQSINGSGEFNPPGAGQRTIRFRVRARDNNGTDGTWSSDRTLYVDNNVPRIGSTDPLRLVQYTDGTFTTVLAERAYVSNMYIRGEWYLVGSVEDESGIQAINVTGSDAGTLITEPDWFVDGAFIPATSLYNYTIRIPVGRPLTDTSTGQQSYSIYVEDGSDPTGAATQPIVLNYDNQPPVVDVLTHGGIEIDAANPIVQSNNTFTIASTATEAGLTDSGFERLVFFFVRQGTDNRVYNPMTAIDAGQALDDVTGNRTYLSELTWTAGDVPRLPVAGATRSGEDSLTHASIENNENVRVGGLVRIAGVDRLIKTVNRTTGNITFAPGANISYTAASFAYGLVVDNTTIETGVWSGSTLTSIINDDGDGMIESVVKSGGSYAWDASINSLNIPDGPIELHYVAYDKAGNSVAGVATTSVANNRPRIARVLLGTDLSGDNAFSSTELATYYTAISGSEPSLVNLASSAFIMKGRLAVIPEFVGGNGTLRYVWASNGDAADVWDGITYPAASFGGALLDFTTVTLSDNGAVTYTTAIEIIPGAVTAMDDVLKLFSFAVWDETEETTQGTSSQWARLNVPLTVDVVDGVAPRVAISPFFWTDSVTPAADNSLYAESRNNGHIEISLNALGDTDPKVSGSISIRGTAYDDQRLSALYSFIGANTGTVSTYAFTGAAATLDVNGRLYARMATYDPATTVWTGTDQWATNGWSFTVTPDYQNQSGHKVDWQLNINTARITNVAALNQLIRMVAEDRTPNASSETATPTGFISTNNVPGYQVDVVPYIRSIQRSVDYNTFRSRQGRAGVRQGEVLTFSGFNIFNTVADTVVIGTASQTIPGTATNTGFTVTVPATARSGAVTVTVNSVTTLNNLNTNANSYNKESDANNSDTALWNDDRYIHVWRSDDNQTGDNRGYFNGSIDPEYPSMTQNAGVLYGAWSNYATSSVNYIGNNADFVLLDNRVAASYDPLEHTDISYGNRPGVIYNANTYGNGFWRYDGAGGVVVWDAQANAAGSVTTGNGYEVEYLYHDRRLMQFVNQRIAYQGNNIHVSYYDTETKSVKYWYTASNGNVAYSARWINIDGGYDAHDGAYTERYGTNTNTGATITNIYVANGDTVTNGQNVMRDSAGTTYTAPVAGVVDIPIAVGTRISGTNTDNNQSLIFSVRTSTNRVVDVAGTSRTAAAGEFSAIDTTPTNNFPVIVYYDITNRTLKLARSTAVNPNATQWTLQNVMAAGDPNFSFSGKYVSMKIDTLGYVHIAYFRNSTGDLIYTKSTNNPTDGATAYTFGPSVILDSTGSVGVWVDLTLISNRPWISYLDSSYTYSFDGIKLAYYEPTFEIETGDVAGEPDNRDGWEYMNAALAYEVESVRTSIEADGAANFWGVAIGYGSSDYYRIGYYVD